MKQWTIRFVAGATIAVMSGCGGGGSGSTVSDNPTATISGADFGG